MYRKRKWIPVFVLTVLLLTVVLPGQAVAVISDAGMEWSEKNVRDAFRNPDGMVVDLIYYYSESDGGERLVGRVDRTVIPAGIVHITVELQQQLLPDGYDLKSPAPIPLKEDTQEVKIPVSPETPEKPTEKPSEPEQWPSDPTENPAEKPSEPEDQPAEPMEKPDEPTSKPGNPGEKPSGKPDHFNPKTGDRFAPELWLALGAGAVLALLACGKAVAQK